MSTTTPPNLGVIISNVIARRVIYAAYVLALVVAGALQAYYGAVSIPQPDWLTGTLSVLVYLGIPIGSLALANVAATSTSEDPRRSRV